MSRQVWTVARVTWLVLTPLIALALVAASFLLVHRLVEVLFPL